MRLSANLPAYLARRPSLLIVVFATLVLALIWATVATLIFAERDRVFDDARHELRGAQRVMGAHVRRTFETAITQLSAVDAWLAQASRSPAQADLADLEGVTKRLQAYTEGAPSFRLFDASGRTLAFGGAGAEGIDASDREFIQVMLNAAPGTMHVGATILTRDTNVTVIPVVLKAQPNAYQVAMIAAGIPVDDFHKAFADFMISAPGTTGIFRRDGKVLVQDPDPERFVGKHIPKFDYEKFIAKWGEYGIIEHTSVVNGRPRITAYVALNPIPLLVYASIHVDQLNARWWSEAINDLMLGGLATVLAIALSAWILVLIRRKDRDALRLTQALREAEAANRSKSDFMAKMSHELRTPLNAILGFSEMISDVRFEALASRHRDYARDIHRSGRHLLALIDQLLDIAKIESGVVQLHETTIDLQEFLAECVAVTAPLARANKLQVSLSVEPAARALVADHKQLRQMMLNLLSNAAKFNRPDGRIDVLACRVPDGLNIIVADTGIGIPAAARAHIFEPFGRGGSQVASTVEGIGLGLPITKALVELHSGWIELDSSAGGGTTATLHFPASRIPPDRIGSIAA
ncbi:MAG: sensor histidine kinase [Rhodospirillales bacterium]|nr:sensor histidine kinase [Rhodospirillales bacterium]